MRARLVGIERLTWDIVVGAPELEPTVVLGDGVDHGVGDGVEHGVGEGVRFCTDEEWASLATSVAFHTGRRSPGGNVGNALVAARRSLAGIEANAVGAAVWMGPHALDIDSRRALRSLRAAGITVVAMPTDGGSTITVTWAQGDRGNRTFVRLGRWPENLPDSFDYEAEWVLAGLDTLLGAPAWLTERITGGPGKVALRVNHGLVDQDRPERLERLLAGGSLGLVSGRSQFVEALGRSMGVPVRRWPEEFGCAVVSTEGSRGAVVFTTELPPTRLPIQSTAQRRNTLGAGDATMGGTIAGLLVGLPIQSAVELGMKAAAECLEWPTARPPDPAGRSALFPGAPIDPGNAAGRLLVEDLAGSLGPTVVTGGQTGVDELANSIANTLGVANVAVFPRGYQREDEHDSVRDLPAFKGSRLTELGVEGYRERTWLSAFLGDATLLFDFVGSSGSRECLSACAALGRSVHAPRTTEQAALVGRALAREGVRVLNVAGNRGSTLDERGHRLAAACIERALVEWAFALPQPPELPAVGPFSAHELQNTATKLAVPSSGPMHLFLRRALGLVPVPDHRSLTYRSSRIDVEVVSGRPRDFATWLEEGRITHALAGLDELREGGVTQRPLYDTGLFGVAIVLLADPTARNDEGSVVTALPRLARVLLEGTPWSKMPLRAVQGATETWIELGAASMAVDTWATGRTARAHGLEPVAELGRSSLCLVGDESNESLVEDVKLLTKPPFGLWQGTST